MNWANPIQYLRDHLKVLKRILYLLMAATIVFDILIPRHEAHFWETYRVLVGFRSYLLCPFDSYYEGAGPYRADEKRGLLWITSFIQPFSLS